MEMTRATGRQWSRSKWWMRAFSVFLGTRVLIAVERLMGMLLVAISVQMFLDGLQTYLVGAIP